MSPDTIITIIAFLFLVVGMAVAYLSISLYQERKGKVPILTKFSWGVILVSIFVLIGLVFGNYARPFLIPQLKVLFPTLVILPTPTIPIATQIPVTDEQPIPTLILPSESLLTPTLQAAETERSVLSTPTFDFVTKQPDQFPVSTPLSNENLQAVCTGQELFFFMDGIPVNDPCADKVDPDIFVPGMWIITLQQLDEKGNVERCFFSYLDGDKSNILQGAMQVLPKDYAYNVEFQSCP